MTPFESNLTLLSAILGNRRDTNHKWFVSFGSLLYLIRDHKHGVPFNQDIDISYMGSDYDEVRHELMREGIQPVHKIVSDVDGNTLNEGFKFEDGMSLDIFTWLRKDDYLWHTYDFSMQHPENGIPSKYHFKNIPAWMLDNQPCRYEFCYDEYTVIPKLYGTLLDYWYPGWIVPDPEFGTSHAQNILNIGGCQELCQ